MSLAGLNAAGAGDGSPPLPTIERIHAAGPRLRDSTAEWFRRNADRVSLDRSLETVLDAYAQP